MPLHFLSPIHKANRQIGLHLETKMAALGVSNPEAHLLSYLAAYGPCSVGQLKGVFGHKGSTMTSLLDRLATRDLIARSVHPQDRRSFLIATTPSGRSLAERIQTHLEALESAISNRLDGADLEGFQRVMDAIAHASRAAAQEPNAEENEP